MNNDIKKAGVLIAVLAAVGLATLFNLNLDAPMGGVEDDVAYILDLTSTTEAECLLDTEKYCQIASTTYNDLNYRVFEYVTPSLEPGYQVIFRKASGTDEYVKSVGYGPEADNRTSEWSLMSNEE